jgi:hypothetical protein
MDRYKQLVGFLGQMMSPNIRYYFHRIRTHDPNVPAGEDIHDSDRAATVIGSGWG